jgi:hypothetical protein
VADAGFAIGCYENLVAWCYAIGAFRYVTIPNGLLA